MKLREKTTFRRKYGLLLLLLCMISLAVLCICFRFRRLFPVRLLDIGKILLNKLFPAVFHFSGTTWTEMDEQVIYYMVFPRITVSFIIGAALSVAGASYQAVFNNPMASPRVLGVSSGACFGAALAIYLGAARPQIILSALGFGLLSMLLVYTLSKTVRKDFSYTLILIGIMVGSLFELGVSYIKMIGDPYGSLPEITYWLMGSLANMKLEMVGWIGIPVLLCLIALFLLRWRMNFLSMGEEEARSMGVNIRRLRMEVIFIAGLLTAISISFTGMIGFVGLVVPNFVRLMVGDDQRLVLPVSVLTGGSFLMLANHISCNMSPMIIPLGIITSFVGVPFFIYCILLKGKKHA